MAIFYCNLVCRHSAFALRTTTAWILARYTSQSAKAHTHSLSPMAKWAANLKAGRHIFLFHYRQWQLSWASSDVHRQSVIVERSSMRELGCMLLNEGNSSVLGAVFHTLHIPFTVHHQCIGLSLPIQFLTFSWQMTGKLLCFTAKCGPIFARSSNCNEHELTRLAQFYSCASLLNSAVLTCQSAVWVVSGQQQAKSWRVHKSWLNRSIQVVNILS